MAGRYDRAFITLKQERGDYSINGKAAMGSSIIESMGRNGKISMSVQNLKPKVLYRCYLIRVDNGKALGISLGTVPVDARGQGQIRKEVDAQDVEGSGFPLEDFSVTALIVPRDRDLIVPLVGYRKENVMWKDSFIEYRPGMSPQPEPETPVLPEIPVAAEKVWAEPETPITTEAIQEGQAVPGAEETVNKTVNETVDEEPAARFTAYDAYEAPEPGIIAKDVKREWDASAPEENKWKNLLIQDEACSTEEPAEHNDDPESIEPDLHEEFRTMVKRFNKELEELKYYTFLSEEEQEAYEVATAEELVKTQPDSLSDIFETYETLTPFEHQSRPVQWVRITTKELKHLPVDYHLLMSSPFIASAYRQYQHLILGYVDDKWGRQYILGVPERYEPEYKTKALRMGFNQFKSCENLKPRGGEYGYWLMGIEIK